MKSLDALLGDLPGCQLSETRWDLELGGSGLLAWCRSLPEMSLNRTMCRSVDE